MVLEVNEYICVYVNIYISIYINIYIFIRYKLFEVCKGNTRKA